MLYVITNTWSMKTIPALIALLCCFSDCMAQSSNEFKNNGNGLIYADTTIQQLKFIVDSLNLKYKVCDLSRTYQSKLQARANFVSVNKSDIRQAKKDIDSGIDFGEFEKKYGRSKIEKDLLIVRFSYENYKGEQKVEYSNPNLGKEGYHEIEIDAGTEKKIGREKGTWIYNYEAKSSDYDGYLDAFYLTTSFAQKAVPDKYARMIQYSECMVDTNTQIFYESAKKSGVRFGTEDNADVNSFIDYVHTQTARPVYNESDYNAYYKSLAVWDSLKYITIDSLNKYDKKFGRLLNKALESVQAKNLVAGDEFEEYLGRYRSRSIELDLKRRRIVVGGCSMDNSPRYHALNIAKLAAETVNWEVFLRSHLDIMNDNFSRVSDGSYAWAGRKTYIKELELLDINVQDLLLGISLRIENPSNNHYYGSISRLGRALAETAYAAEIETAMFAIISDTQMDDYNRILIYYLFNSYCNNLSDDSVRQASKQRLLGAINTLPDYLSARIDLK